MRKLACAILAVNVILYRLAVSMLSRVSNLQYPCINTVYKVT